MFSVEHSDLFVSQPSLAVERDVRHKRILARFGDAAVRFVSIQWTLKYFSFNEYKTYSNSNYYIILKRYYGTLFNHICILS